MTAEQITDADAAKEWAESWVAQLSGVRGWSNTALEEALADIGDAYEVADEAEWWGADATVFWTELYDEAQGWDVPNLGDVLAVFAQAAGVAERDQDAEDAYDFSSMVYAVAEESAEDYGELAEDIGDVAAEVAPGLVDWRLWTAAGVLALFLAVAL